MDNMRIGTLSRSRSVGYIATEAQGISGAQRITVAAMPIGERARENVDEFSAGMLKTRKHFALVGEGHQKGLERFSRAALGGQTDDKYDPVEFRARTTSSP